MSGVAVVGDGSEIALIDARDPADFQGGHLLLSVNLPTARLVPRNATPVVLCDPAGGTVELLEGLFDQLVRDGTLRLALP